MFFMLTASVIAIVIGCVLKKLSNDMSKFESEILSFSIKELEDISPSYEAIIKALDNQQNIDK